MKCSTKFLKSSCDAVVSGDATVPLPSKRSLVKFDSLGSQDNVMNIDNEAAKNLYELWNSEPQFGTTNVTQNIVNNCILYLEFMNGELHGKKEKRR